MPDRAPPSRIASGGLFRIALLAFVLALPLRAETVAAPDPQSGPGDAAGTEAGAPAEKEAYGLANGAPVAIPIPFNNPTLGAGLALGVAYLFQTAPKTDTSILGIAGFATGTENSGRALLGRFSSPGNRWRGDLFLGDVDLNYDVRVLTRDVRVLQQAEIARAEFRYGWTPEWSAGVSGRFMTTELGVDREERALRLLDLTSDLTLWSAGLVAQYDGLDNDFYPTRGGFARLEAVWTEGDGRILDLSYPRITLAARYFMPLGKRGVLAGQVTGCTVGDEALFFDACLLGGPGGIRGFPYFDRYGGEMLTAQLEYRGRLGKRLGYVAFAGAGDVRRTNFISDEGLNTAAGVGVRYRVSRDFGLDMSLDVTVNDAEETLYYLYVGQAF